MGSPVVHFEIVGRDAKTLQRFYKQAFDWQISPIEGPMDYAMAHPQTEGGINGGIGGGKKGYDGHVTFYVMVPDLDAALRKITDLGGNTVMPPDTVPSGPRIAMFSDPEGHVVGLVQSPADAMP